MPREISLMTPSEIKKWIFWFSSTLLRLEEGHDGGSIGGSRDFSGSEVLVFQPEGAHAMVSGGGTAE